jgi:hypothetical protein
MGVQTFFFRCCRVTEPGAIDLEGDQPVATRAFLGLIVGTRVNRGLVEDILL